MGKGPIINNKEYEEFGNFYRCKIVINNVEFTSVEQYYQYIKCKNNPELQMSILQETNPIKMWKIGQHCELPIDWEINKFKIMKQGIEYKFAQNNELALLLKGTYPHEIIFNEKKKIIPDYWDTSNSQILSEIRSNIT